jgi:dihydrodipicolinate synthase/N-acetylneuraminate lyase
VTALKLPPWRGYFAATPTPFSATGELDLNALRQTIAWFLAQRPHGMVVNGTTGEWYAQTLSERKKVVDTARDAVPGNVPLLVGISSTLPSESLELAKHAQQAGADGLLLTIPPSRRLTAAEIHSFYVEQASRAELPLLIYNVPGVTGYDLPTELIHQLQSIDGVVGVKDNTASMAARLATLRALGAQRLAFSDVLEPESFDVMVAEGVGCGQIGSGMPLGHAMAAAFEQLWAGNVDAAKDTVHRLSAFKREMLQILEPGQPWHAQMKAILCVSGVDAGYPRAPSVSLRTQPERMEALGRLMARYL